MTDSKSIENDHRRWDGPPRTRRLWRPNNQPVTSTEPLTCLPNVQLVLSQVEILPTKTKNLAATKTNRAREYGECAQAMILRRLRESRDLFICPWCDFGSLWVRSSNKAPNVPTDVLLSYSL